MKWKEFKDKLEKLGVKDDDEIWYINMRSSRFGWLGGGLLIFAIFWS